MITRTIYENYTVQSDHNASLLRREIINDKRLKPLYEDFFKALLEDKALKQRYDSELKRGIELHYESTSKIGFSKVFHEGEQTIISTPIQVGNLATKQEGHLTTCTIRHKPFALQEEIDTKTGNAAQRYLEYYLDDMFFQSLFLGGQGGDDHLVTTFNITYELPPDSELENEGQIRKSAWNPVSVGGLFTITSSIAVNPEVEKTIITLQRMVQVNRQWDAELPGEDAMEKLFYDFIRFEAFEIRYRVAEKPNPRGGGRNGTELATIDETAEAAGEGRNQPAQLEVPETFRADFDMTWTPTRNIRSSDLELGAISAPGAVTLSGMADLKWMFHLNWHWRRFKLDDFKAELTVEPQVSVSLGFEADINWEGNPILQELFGLTYPIYFWVSTFPVMIDLNASWSVGTLKNVTTDARATVKFTFNPPAWGVSCTFTPTHTTPWNSGWVGLDQIQTVKIEPDAAVRVNATLGLEGPVKLEALIYKFAGPYVQFIPSLELGCTVDLSINPPCSGTLSAFGAIDGGITLAGWLAGLLNQPSGDICFGKRDIGSVGLGNFP